MTTSGYGHLSALRSDLDRAVALIGGVADFSARVPGLAWTAEQTATHLVIAVNGLGAVLRKDLSGLLGAPATGSTPTENVATMNANSLKMMKISDPREAAAKLRAVGDVLLKAAAEMDSADVCGVPWYGAGSTRTAGVVAAVAHGEILVHGLDIARSQRRRWNIPAASAYPVAQAVLSGMMPYMLTPAGRAFTGTFRIRLRGGPSVVLAIAGGAVTANPPGLRESDIDCTISMAPAASVLAIYGRTARYQLIGTGRIVAYGRRPSLGLRFAELFDGP